MSFVTHSAGETTAVGRHLGALLDHGDLVLLHGGLGAGKTTFVQGLAAGAGVTGYVHSPTFVLVHRYEGRLPLFHLDLYRLEGELEAHDLAIDEMLDEGAVVVEWADRAPVVFPAEHLTVELAFSKVQDARILTLSAVGAHFQALAARLGVAKAR